MDFTLKKYKELLQNILDSDLKIFGISSWYEESPNEGVLIRHDVDRFPKRALRMAYLEASYKVYTTYYFRITKNSFNSGIIKKIAELGHEIGYHYEDLSLAHGDYNLAKKLFEKHLNLLRSYFPIKTIAMHGRPLSKYDNRDLWNKIKFKDFEIQSEAFLSINYANMYYLTDTGRTWSNNAINLRDKAKSLKVDVKSTDDFIGFLKNDNPRRIALTVHPERWNPFGIEYLNSFISDIIVNTIKYFLRFIYKN
jgi:hypothetical protein